MENRQSRPGGASGHGGQKFHQDSEQAKLHKSKLRMENREEKLGKARDRLAAQKPPKSPTTPPPSATTTSLRVNLFSANSDTTRR